MKLAAIMSLALLTSLTLPSWAATSEASLNEGRSAISVEDVTPASATTKFRIVPQIGLASMGYSGKSGGESNERLAAGVTTELGSTKARLLETGLILMPTSAHAVLKDGQTETVNSTYLTIPMMAKIRFVELKSQSWYAKVGFSTAIEVGSNHDKDTNNFDVLGGLGIGGRFAFNRRADFLVEATYNRGLIDVLHTGGSSTNEGFLVTTGLSFNL